MTMRDHWRLGTFDLLADLRLEVDSYALEGLSAAVSPEMVRHCTVVTHPGTG